MAEIPAEFARYRRQIALESFGLEAQKNLKNSRAVLVGAGGVGSAMAGLLAGSGLGRLDIVDCDEVSMTNLHRQTIYKEAQAGQPKAALAAKYAAELNSQCQANALYKKIQDPCEFAKFLRGANLCIDATDSFSARFAVSEACQSLNLPLVYAAAKGFVSQVVLFGDNFYLGDIVADKSAKSEEPQGLPIFPASAHFSGVLAAGIAIRFLSKTEKFCPGKILSFDFSAGKFKEINLR